MRLAFKGYCHVAGQMAAVAVAYCATGWVTDHCCLCMYKCHFIHNSAAETISLNSIILLHTVWIGVSVFQSLIAFNRLLLKVVWCMAFAAFPTPGGWHQNG